MRALVTGATGFLGSHVARLLAERGDEVVALVRRTSDRSRLDGLELGYVEGDVTDRDAVERALHGVTQVFHCAATVEFGPRDPSLMERVNVVGTENVLGAAAEHDIPAVHTSSLAALGPTPRDEPPKDESWWSDDEPAVAYEDTKRRAHRYARSLAEKGAPVRIAMPGGIYGFGDQSTMADLIRAYTLWPIPIGYLPEVRQSTVAVEDCADALVRIADRGQDGDEFVVVAEAVTVAEWLKVITDAAGHRGPVAYLPSNWVRAMAKPGAKVAAWFGLPPSMVPETVAVATHDSAYRGDRLRRELGWDPRPLAHGMQAMVDAIKADEARKRAQRRTDRARARAARL